MTTSYTAPSLTVEDFLAQHPALVPVVAEAQQAAQPYFPDAPLVLEVFEDPEFGDPPKLHLVIVPTSDPAEAAARYRQFQRAWWSRMPADARSQFAIVIEYR
jgi:hypothetical protein